jgi:hypothetical protein
LKITPQRRVRRCSRRNSAAMRLISARSQSGSSGRACLVLLGSVLPEFQFIQVHEWWFGCGQLRVRRAFRGRRVKPPAASQPGSASMAEQTGQRLQRQQALRGVRAVADRHRVDARRCGPSAGRTRCRRSSRNRLLARRARPAVPAASADAAWRRSRRPARGMEPAPEPGLASAGRARGGSCRWPPPAGSRCLVQCRDHLRGARKQRRRRVVDLQVVMPVALRSGARWLADARRRALHRLDRPRPMTLRAAPAPAVRAPMSRRPRAGSRRCAPRSPSGCRPSRTPAVHSSSGFLERVGSTAPSASAGSGASTRTRGRFRWVESSGRGMQKQAFQPQLRASAGWLGSPYLSSPATGAPRLAACTRIWCVRPVCNSTSTRVSPPPGRDARNRVAPACPPGPPAPCARRPQLVLAQRQLDPLHPRRGSGPPAAPDSACRPLAVAHLRVQRQRKALRRLADQQAAGGVAVEPMHQLQLAARPPARSASMTPCADAAAAVHGHAGGLVQHQQALVLVQHASQPLGQPAGGPSAGLASSAVRTGGSARRPRAASRWCGFARPLLTRTSPRRSSR